MIIQFKPSALRQTRWYEYLVRFGPGAHVPTIINKITTNTVEIASIRIYARALQSSVEIARLGPAARNDALTIRTVS
jgi:hypothetical protein